MNYLRRLFFKILEGYLKWMAKFKMPWVKSTLSTEQIRDIMNTAEKGDVLVVRAGGYFSSLHFGMKGFTHVAYCLASETILDSTGIGVAQRDMLAVLNKYTRAALVRPKYNTAQKTNMHARAEAILKQDAEKNIRYNWSLVTDKSDKKVETPAELTCAQLVRDIINHGKPGFMLLRYRFGFLTIAPSDFYLAESKFDVIKEYGK